MVNYKVTVSTGNRAEATTLNNVFIKLVGTDGESKRKWLIGLKGASAFIRGAVSSHSRIQFEGVWTWKALERTECWVLPGSFRSISRYDASFNARITRVGASWAHVRKNQSRCAEARNGTNRDSLTGDGQGPVLRWNSDRGTVGSGRGRCRSCSLLSLTRSSVRRWYIYKYTRFTSLTKRTETIRKNKKYESITF